MLPRLTIETLLRRYNEAHRREDGRIQTRNGAVIESSSRAGTISFTFCTFTHISAYIVIHCPSFSRIRLSNKRRDSPEINVDRHIVLLLFMQISSEPGCNVQRVVTADFHRTAFDYYYAAVNRATCIEQVAKGESLVTQIASEIVRNR